MKAQKILIVCLCCILIEGCFIGISSATPESDLAQQYAPILYFEAGETCFPVTVSYHIDNSYLYEIGNPIPISTAPTADTLAGYTSADYYLDNKKGTVEDDGIITDYQNTMNGLGYTVYAHVDTASNIIQYWFFYAFNDGDLNRHEGDWEMVQISLLNGQPSMVMYSQHHSGQKATWKQVDREEDHIKVYVARGSHANYLRSFSGKIGIASDSVGANGRVLQPSEYTLELLTTQPWLSFAGHWGWVGDSQAASEASSILGESGPEGPQFRESSSMWSNPLGWGAGLTAANDYLFLLEWVLYNFLMIFTFFVVLSLIYLVFSRYRRHKRHGLGPRIFSLLYIDGVNSKSIGNILCIIGIGIAILGLFYPWYTVSGNVTIPDYQTTGLVNMITIDGMNGLQVTLPNSNGPTPLGTFSLPFSVLICVELIFLILGTIGLASSRKLGRKYLVRGIGLLMIFIVIFIIVMLLGSLVPAVSPMNGQGSTEISNAIHAITISPIHGQYTFNLVDVPGGVITLEWGYGLGAYLLLFAAFLLIMAGLLEIVAHATFYEEREYVPRKKVQKREQEKTPDQPDVFQTEEEKK